MAKNSNKKAKFKPVTFKMLKCDFKKLLENQLKHTATYSYNKVLNGVKLILKNNLLIMVTTDACTLLESKTRLDEPVTNPVEIVLSGLFLSKLKLNNAYEWGRKKEFSCLDFVEITIFETYATIKDERNDIIYKIPGMQAKFPDYEKLFPKKDDKELSEVCFDPKLMAKFSSVAGKNDGLVLTMNPQRPLSAVVLESSSTNSNTSYKALLMPMKDRRKQA